MKSSTLPAREREKKNIQTNPSRKRSQGKGEKKRGINLIERDIHLVGYTKTMDGCME